MPRRERALLSSSGSGTKSSPQFGYDDQALLLPPAGSRAGATSPDPSVDDAASFVSSRRSSFASDRGVVGAIEPKDARPKYLHPTNPFRTSRSPSPTEHVPQLIQRSDSANSRRSARHKSVLNSQTISEKYTIQPSTDLLIYPKDIEADDELHDPKFDTFKGRKGFGKRGIVNISGLICIAVGVTLLFIGYPVISFVRKAINPYYGDTCTGWQCLEVDKVPTLENFRMGLIDPDTPSSAMSKTSSLTGKTWELVFSDEFNKPNRTFYPQDDVFWEAVDLWYGVTQDLEWYDPDAITTRDGYLDIQFDAFKNHGLNYRSGMLQGWNKFCFQGGRIEVSLSLPGRGDTPGFWAAAWTMGNLGRPGYAATTEGMWPYSTDECGAGITPNQSSSDGVSYLPGMKMPSCVCANEDTISPGIGRAAPELDIIEASVSEITDGSTVGSASQSLQLAPFDVPNYDYMYVNDPQLTNVNSFVGTQYQQSFSSLTNLNNEWYDGEAYQIYGYEYEGGNDGQIQWFVGDEPTWGFAAPAIGANGNVGARLVPMEPMTIVLNLGMAESFSAPDFSKLPALLPAHLRVDYVRVYQDTSAISCTCDPVGYETSDYIANHPLAYQNPNATEWSHTDYPWPRNSLMDGCAAAQPGPS